MAARCRALGLSGHGRLTDGERRAAHSASSVRSAERHIAEGKCEKCTKPLDRNSVRERTEHLEMHRQPTLGIRRRIEPGTNGRQPGTLKAVAASREKRSLALLAPCGITPKHAGVSLNAASEAQLKVMPDKARAMRQTALFQRAAGRASSGQRRSNGRSSNCSRPARLSAWAREECRSRKRWSDKCIHSAHRPGQTGCLRPVRAGFKLMQGKRLSGAGIPVTLPRLLSPHCFSQTQRVVRQHKLTERFFRVSALP